MSDANETEWNKAGRPSGPQGETKSGLAHGLTGNSQITASHDSMGMGIGQGQRPKAPTSMSISRGGKKFKTK